MTAPLRYEDRLRRESLLSRKTIGFRGFRIAADPGVRLTRHEAGKLADFIRTAREAIESDDLSCPWMERLDTALEGLDQEVPQS